MSCRCTQCRGRVGETPAEGQGFEAVPIHGMQHAMDLYRAFNHFGPSRMLKVRHSRVIPPIVVELGELVGLIYRSDKGQPEQPLTYIHRMEDPPRLVSNVEGTQLYIVGGSYRITPHGIEG